ncbi:hypothetical protein [Acetobacter orientalis]|uniref:hypothetical protein n=1 Tax=Acetobacter orientalis TaxID=146474 RepID=UPI0039EBF28D
MSRETDAKENKLFGQQVLKSDDMSPAFQKSFDNYTSARDEERKQAESARDARVSNRNAQLKAVFQARKAADSEARQGVGLSKMQEGLEKKEDGQARAAAKMR